VILRQEKPITVLANSEAVRTLIPQPNELVWFHRNGCSVRPFPSSAPREAFAGNTMLGGRTMAKKKKKAAAKKAPKKKAKKKK
jgi:hypothetical protein